LVNFSGVYLLKRSAPSFTAKTQGTQGIARELVLPIKEPTTSISKRHRLGFSGQ
jgi:hypothetical protein